MYVPPQFRQQGRFKSLYKHVREEAQKAGAAGLRLYADVGNERAHTAVSCCCCMARVAGWRVEVVVAAAAVLPATAFSNGI